jgi:hypothetical protein
MTGDGVLGGMQLLQFAYGAPPTSESDIIISPGMFVRCDSRGSSSSLLISPSLAPLERASVGEDAGWSDVAASGTSLMLSEKYFLVLFLESALQRPASIYGLAVLYKVVW